MGFRGPENGCSRWRSCVYVMVFLKIVRSKVVGDSGT